MPLDLLVTGGRVATLAGERGFGWVEAVGMKDGRVAFAGSAVELESRADDLDESREISSAGQVKDASCQFHVRSGHRRASIAPPVGPLISPSRAG